MDKDIMTQLLMAGVIFETRWFPVGKLIWDVSGREYYPTAIEINGKIWGGKELADFAIESKKNGSYAIAIDGYLQLLEACRIQFNKIPVVLVRQFFKILIAANAFQQAYSLIATILTDIQQTPNTDQTELFAYTTYFEGLSDLAINVVDNDDLTVVPDYCKKFAENPSYVMVADLKDIYKGLLWIRENQREFYNK